MYVNNSRAQPEPLGPVMGNVIDFPLRPPADPGEEPPPAAATTGKDGALARLWRETGSGRLGTFSVPEALRRIETADRPGSLCVLRVNEYRLLEETFGRHTAQALLRLVEQRLRAGLRRGDRLERIAEDELALILDGLDESEQVAAIAQRLLANCTGVYNLDGLPMHVNASVGIARFPVDASEPAVLIRYARIALHETHPHSPAPYHFFSQSLLEQLQGRVWLAAELEEALAQDRFVLHYQPLFAIDGQRTLGAEALLRLRSAGGELIAPDRFIPLAEEMGLIVPIGRWVIREACRQLKRWQQQGYGPLRMAVNVSPAQLADAHFVDLVTAAVQEAGIAYGDLELEITEGQVVEHLPLIEQAFAELGAKGVRIAIDDFGTGYSALAYLTRLAWTTVKIDRSFLADIPRQPRVGRIVAAIIAMARELDLEVTAEGVETEAQYRFLARAGCHVGQGYGFSRPQTAGDFQQLLRAPAGPCWSKDGRD